MILHGPSGHAAAALVATVVAEHARMVSSYKTSETPTSATGISLPETEGEQAELRAPVRESLETYDWSRPKILREYIRLEQRVLAKVATQEERQRYASMKRDRNSHIFADRYVRDYAEIERLRNLSEALTKVQLYLQPFQI